MVQLGRWKKRAGARCGKRRRYRVMGYHGKACGMPVYKILGANSDKVNAYASAGFYAEDKNQDALKREFEGYLKRGYKAFKMKAGRARECSRHILRYMPNQQGMLTRHQDEERYGPFVL